MVSHIVGAAFGFFALILCLIKSSLKGDVYGVVSSIVYGVSMILLYTMSSVYHGLKHELGKKVMRILDHCAIYLLIAGTTTPVALVAIRPIHPTAAWIFFGFEWTLAITAIVLNAIDLKKFRVFSMVCNLFMGWAVVFIWNIAVEALGLRGFYFMLLGGIMYTIGAVLYSIGKKIPYMHSIFHLFVLAGSVLQFISIYIFTL